MTGKVNVIFPGFQDFPGAVGTCGVQQKLTVFLQEGDQFPKINPCGPKPIWDLANHIKL